MRCWFSWEFTHITLIAYDMISSGPVSTRFTRYPLLDKQRGEILQEDGKEKGEKNKQANKNPFDLTLWKK